MAAIADRLIRDQGAKKIMTMQHRDELTDQNCAKFRRFTNGRHSVSLFNSKTKSMRGRCVFGMVQTLARNLERVPELHAIQVDEGHHIPSRTYLDVIRAGREKNPDMKLCAVTATPVRGDRKTLAGTLTNVAHVVEMGDLIANGYLVPPITYKPTIGDVRGLVNSVHKGANEFDMEEAATIMNKVVVTKEVINHWERKARNRKTIVFCTNVTHAEGVYEAWKSRGYRTGIVHSKMSSEARQATLKAYGRGELQVLINVMVLTEGFDDQPTSCVVILRPASHRSTFIQIVGRGLRKVDQSIYPGLIKRDCIVMDFCSNHNSLEQDISEAFLAEKKKTAVGLEKICPKCMAVVPARSRECGICGHEFPYTPIAKEAIENARMIEIDLLGQSKMLWIDLFENGKSLMASGFKAWAAIVNTHDDEWAAIGSKKADDGPPMAPKVLDLGARTQCLASAHDWMSSHETNKKAGKEKSWVSMPANKKQIDYIKRYNRFDTSSGMTKYAASCRIEYLHSEPMIINAVNAGVHKDVYQVSA